MSGSVRDILGTGAVSSTAEAETPVDFDALLSDIVARPERLLDPDLTAEQILEIQKRINPYAGIAGPPPAPEKKRVVACSYTNLREDYLRRFAVTGITGFLYQMLKEWEVPADARRWVPAGKAVTAEDTAPFEAMRLAELLANASGIARDSAEAAALAAELKRAAAAAELVNSETQFESLEAAKTAAEAAAVQRAESVAAEARAAGLLYVATHAASRLGTEAADRLRSTADKGMQHKEVREVLGKYPLPPPASSIEAPAALAKEIITGFLNAWLQFDPSVHVRSGHNAAAIAAALAEKAVGAGTVTVDTADGGHLTVAAASAPAVAPAPEHAEALKTIRDAGPRAASAMVALLREHDLGDAAQVALADEGSREAFMHYLAPIAADSPARPALDVVPPQDTHHRLNYYMEVNYEELRTVTEALYPERPDLDWAIAMWDVFEGTSKEVDAAFEKHCQRYQDEVPSAIRALEFGAWSLLADFKENRKKIQFYNSNTDVLKRILDRHADDKRIGAELMRNRVRQAKAKNIAEDGPDAQGLGAYKRNQSEKGAGLGSKGAEKVISNEEMRRLERARGNPKAAKELEALDHIERTIERLESAEKQRPLLPEEISELKQARDSISRAHEMAEVPDDAIQVDVFTTDGSTGTINKTHFYTRADDADDSDAKSEARAPRPSAATVAAAESKSSHPAALASLAPYALEHLHAERAAERAALERAQKIAP